MTKEHTGMSNPRRNQAVKAQRDATFLYGKGKVGRHQKVLQIENCQTKSGTSDYVLKVILTI
jgi:hypothetical protein